MKAFIKTAVIGHPVSHSKSPLIHRTWIAQYGLQGSYEALDLAPENLEKGVAHLIAEGYTGFNITVPHKEAVMAMCDVLEPQAMEIGAVNTVFMEDGLIKGMNTDAYGFLHNILDQVPAFSFAGKQAVVLGAGGAARAVIRGLLDQNVAQIHLLNRTRDKAESLVRHFSAPLESVIKVTDWGNRHAVLRGVDLLVNTTSLGMTGQPALDLDLTALPQAALVNDIVYAPLYTALLLQAETRGNPVVTGIGMLLHQARPAFQKWFGVLPEVTPALKALVSS